MSDVAIRAEGLGKQYTLGGPKERYRTLRDQLVTLGRSARRGFRRAPRPEAPPFWALKDVAFEVNRGDVVGIIGRNGAGKSTLLKILSRITEPTEGWADIHGRIGSLLEVGTGFHPELSGRENVYLNGAILGMRRAEITRQFDAIIAFAEVERFVDTPVKRYSSGMYTRLAFAVAAHLNPDILVVDEVLAVGDAAFQQKCMGKMNDVARGGRTVLFVSHNMHAVRALCRVGCVLDAGRVVRWGGVEECVESYFQTQSAANASYTAPAGGGGCRVLTAEVRARSGGPPDIGVPLVLDAECEFDPPTREPKLGFVVQSAGGERILNANNSYQPFVPPASSVRRGRFVCDLGVVPLVPGRYHVTLWLGDQTGDREHLPDCLSIEIPERDIWGRGQLPPKNAGHLYWPTEFRFDPAPEAE